MTAAPLRAGRCRRRGSSLPAPTPPGAPAVEAAPCWERGARAPLGLPGRGWRLGAAAGPKGTPASLRRGGPRQRGFDPNVPAPLLPAGTDLGVSEPWYFCGVSCKAPGSKTAKQTEKTPKAPPHLGVWVPQRAPATPCPASALALLPAPPGSCCRTLGPAAGTEELARLLLSPPGLCSSLRGRPGPTRLRLGVRVLPAALPHACSGRFRGSPSLLLQTLRKQKELRIKNTLDSALRTF